MCIYDYEPVLEYIILMLQYSVDNMIEDILMKSHDAAVTSVFRLHKVTNGSIEIVMLQQTYIQMKDVKVSRLYRKKDK